MARLAIVAVMLLCLGREAQGAEPLGRWNKMITEASKRFNVPPNWISRVIEAESGGRTELHGRPIVSPAGAMGLMQLMPETWAELRARHGLGPDPHDPRDNILAGTAYLRAMYDRFGYPGLFAAYNAGPARYEQHLATGLPLPSETRAYLRAVAPLAGRRANEFEPRGPGNKLIARRGRSVGRGETGSPDQSRQLFVVLADDPAAKDR